MDIEIFYDSNPKRRTSREYTFGSDWTDEGGVRWECNWVQDTGELYVMREPSEPIMMDPLGDTRVADMAADEVTVEILGTIPDLESVEVTLEGWVDAQDVSASLNWIRDRVAGGPHTLTPGTHGTDPDPESLPGSG